MSDDRIISTFSAPAWLPDGAQADVVLAGDGGTAPEPTCVVRLLLTRAGQVLTVPRPDGRGVDLPSAVVGDGAVADALDVLVARFLGPGRAVRLLGYVRNVVAAATADYPWPAPLPHFTVWHATLAPDEDAPADADDRAGWVDLADAGAHLGHRHWWPLSAHAAVPRG